MMRKVIYRMSVSLDGFIEGPNGDINWWAPDAELHQHFNDLENTVDLDLYGRGCTRIQRPSGPRQTKTHPRQST